MLPISIADFLHGPSIAAKDMPEIDPDGPSRFFNRELSWLGFNWRVLEEAENPRVPLLERLRFLSISATNLDEFYTVRVAGLRELAKGGKTAPAQDGLTPAEQLVLINKDARKLMERQQSIWTALSKEMAKEGIEIVTPRDLSKSDRKHLDHVFLTQIFHILTPIAVDPAHPFPFIPNTGYTLALELQHEEEGHDLQELLPIPAQTPRFVALPHKQGRHRFILLEDVLVLSLNRLFPGYKLTGSCAFRVLRDSDLEVEEEAEDLVREFEVALKRRRRGDVVRLKMSADAPKRLRQKVVEELKVREDEVIELKGLIGISDLKELVLDDRPDLLWPSFSPRVPERVQDHDGDMFAAIRQKDMLLQHPYETFDMVVRFLKQAAADPDVVAIKQTLYRTSDQSPIVDALCEAAEAGKVVTALVELKARFDEAANINQSRKLERAGVHVVYGFMNYKMHAKISLVVRREGSNLATFTHYGTGNYHPITAKVYTDLSFFTCDTALGTDANRVFNYISGYAKPERLDNLSISPLTMKATLLERVAEEAEHALAGRPARIWAKMNSLVEKDVIDALYLASQAGVQIELVVRGICCLRPGIAGLSDNIRVKSIVGRFLEHSRIVCFGNGAGLPSDAARVYISSADWMGRNLNRRVETLVEIKNPTVKEQIVDQIMVANLRDQANSWILSPNGQYDRPEVKAEAFACHAYFVEVPSLSGRGSAGASDVKRLAKRGN